jgi:hypothetical protein
VQIAEKFALTVTDPSPVNFMNSAKEKFVSPNLELQMLFYLNVCLTAIWVPVQLGVIIWKVCCFG